MESYDVFGFFVICQNLLPSTSQTVLGLENIARNLRRRVNRARRDQEHSLANYVVETREHAGKATKMDGVLR